MTMLHAVAILLILAGMGLSLASLLGSVPFAWGTALFAAGTVIELGGWAVAIWTDDKKKPREEGPGSIS